jgi:D-amino-acid dehydrogenase
MRPITRARNVDLIVIGAGVIGSACAFRLAQAGREVLLLDADDVGMGASFGNAGHIATEQVFPLASAEVIRASWRYLLNRDSPLRLRVAYLLPILPWLARFVWAARTPSFARGVAALLALQQSARADMAQLLQDAAVGHLLHLNGHLEVWESATGRASALSQARRLRPHGIESLPLSASALAESIRGLGSQVQGAVHYPDSAHVDDPHAVCTGLAQALLRHSGRISQGHAERLEADSDGVSVRLQGGSTLRARQVLVCAGAWSKPLVASLGYRIPLDTERGYHITLPRPAQGVATLPELTRPIASAERKVIVTPMSMGLRMAGTVEFGGLHLPPDPHRYELLKRHLQALLPGTDTTQASTWMGFRPSLPDHLPVLGVAPRHPNVFLAFGHQHLGLTLAGVTARVMTEVVQGRRSPIELAPYSAARFAFA